MTHILLEIFGGLGLFFVGINILSDSIKQLGSGYAPKIIRTFATNDVTAALSGIAAGVATSSGKAVTFSLVALGELGVLNLRKSLPIVMGGSIGSAFIVLWASIDFQLLIFVLMGIAGALYQFGNKKNANLKLITGIILGFALLFYGLELIKLGAAPIKELAWFHDYLKASQGHWLMALLIGAVLAFVSQSGSSVAIIAISLVNTGMLGTNEAIMLVFGTNIGSGISTAALGVSMTGLSRQLIFFHGYFKVVGVVVMVPLLYLEVYTGTPLIKSFVSHFSQSASTQIALIYLLYEIITGIAVAGFLTPIARWMTGATGPVTSDLGVIASPNLHGVKVVIAHSEGDNIAGFHDALSREGINVLAAKPYSADWRRILSETRPDVLLVNLSESFDQSFCSLETLLEDIKVPVVFNDTTEIPINSEKVTELAQSIGRKLQRYATTKARPRVAQLAPKITK